MVKIATILVLSFAAYVHAGQEQPSPASIVDSDQLQDHEQSEQLQAFLVAEPSPSTSGRSPCGHNHGSHQEPATSEQQESGAIAVSPTAFLLQLIYNNLLATQRQDNQVPKYDNYPRPCRCGCKCAHGARQQPPCATCQERPDGYKPCCQGRYQPNYSMMESRPQPYFYYPVYYDAASGAPLQSAQSQYSPSYSYSPYVSSPYASYGYQSSPYGYAAAQSYSPYAAASYASYPTYSSPYAAYSAPYATYSPYTYGYGYPSGAGFGPYGYYGARPRPIMRRSMPISGAAAMQQAQLVNFVRYLRAAQAQAQPPFALTS